MHDANFLSHIAELLGEPVLSVERIEAGMTNFNFKICTAKSVYVVRLPGEGSNLIIKREQEAANIDAVRPFGINVENVFYDKYSGLKISRYVRDIAGQLDEDNRLKNFAAVVLALHHSGIYFTNSFSLFDQLDYYEMMMDRFSIELEASYHQVKTEMRYVYNEIQREKNFHTVACHNDLIADNFLVESTNKTYLIDWEYSGMNDYLWDVASFISENCDPESEDRFLYHYSAGKPLSGDLRQKVEIYKFCQDIFWSVWARFMSFFGREYLLYSKSRFERGLAVAQRLNILSTPLDS